MRLRASPVVILMSLVIVMVAFQNCSPSKFESMLEPETQQLAVVELIPEEPEPLPPTPTPTPGIISDPLAQCQVTGDSPLIAVGARRTISCPANCPTEDVYGSDIYTSDTPVCEAAVHAGVILKAQGGSVTYQYVGSFPGPFASSDRRGIQSQPWEGAWNAFQILRPSGTDVSETTDPEEPGLQPSTCNGAFQTGLVCRKPMKVAIITDNAPTLSESTIRKCRAYCQALGGSSCCGLTKSSEFPGQYNCMAGRDEIPAVYEEPSPMDYDLNLANKFRTETRAMSCSSSFAAENPVLYKAGALKCATTSFVESEYASIANLPANLPRGTDVFGQSISGIKAHYYSQGYLDKRSTSHYAESNLKPSYNGEAYAAVNWDVLLAGIPAYHHYQSCGYTQDRAAYPSIDFK